MKKGKLGLKIAIGLATFGLLFTGCNNEDATAKKGGNAVKVTTPVTSAADVEEVFTDVLKEYADFFGKVQAPASRGAAKTGKAAGEQLADFTTGLIDFATANGMDVGLLLSGLGGTKDLSYSGSIDLADICPSDVLEATYSYVAKLANVSTTYDQFINEYKLTDVAELASFADDFVALSKLKLGLNASYTASTKAVSASIDTAEGVRVGSVDKLLTKLLKEVGYTIPSDAQVPEGLKYVSVTNETKLSSDYTAGKLGLVPQVALPSNAKVSEKAEVRFNLITSEGKGGYFVITPTAECSLKDLKEGKANVGLTLSVSDGRKETFSAEYTEKDVKAFMDANKELFNSVEGYVDGVLGYTFDLADGLVNYVSSVVKALLPTIDISNKGDLDDMINAIDRLI